MFDPEFSAYQSHSPAALVVSLSLVAAIVVAVVVGAAVQLA